MQLSKNKSTLYFYSCISNCWNILKILFKIFFMVKGSIWICKEKVICWIVCAFEVCPPVWFQIIKGQCQKLCLLLRVFLIFDSFIFKFLFLWIPHCESFLIFITGYALKSAIENIDLFTHIQCTWLMDSATQRWRGITFDADVFVPTVCKTVTHRLNTVKLSDCVLVLFSLESHFWWPRCFEALPDFRVPVLRVDCMYRSYCWIAFEIGLAFWDCMALQPFFFFFLVTLLPFDFHTVIKEG